MFEQKIILRDTRKAKFKKTNNVQFSTTKRKSLLTAYIKKNLKKTQPLSPCFMSLDRLSHLQFIIRIIGILQIFWWQLQMVLPTVTPSFNEKKTLKSIVILSSLYYYTIANLPIMIIMTTKYTYLHTLFSFCWTLN